MKSLAEQLREFMDRVAETPMGKRYDFTTTVEIPFPENGTPEEQDAWVEEISVGVNYSVEGGYRSGRVGHPDNWTPDETPELTEVKVFVLATGEEITSTLPKSSISEITDKVWSHYDKSSKDDDGDYEDY
jgi:hypothetical protein